ncbi:hypothetical protein [Sphingomonas sanguinis]|uniref:Uncharacterized protein n=1 Tax=Sphingomonas sanguinis TaxID=33051 RepID=A0A147J4E1_9SPHN|nr:hypothetical protein [Sphingomonas sanguinis]KTW06286.1 hypothetical protein NS258_16865 [Sphingomonas sanguinis]
MSGRLTHLAIGAGIALSLLGWGAGQVGVIALDALRPAIRTATPVAHSAPTRPFSIQLSVEVRP